MIIIHINPQSKMTHLGVFVALFGLCGMIQNSSNSPFSQVGKGADGPDRNPVLRA